MGGYPVKEESNPFHGHPTQSQIYFCGGGNEEGYERKIHKSKTVQILNSKGTNLIIH